MVTKAKSICMSYLPLFPLIMCSLVRYIYQAKCRKFSITYYYRARCFLHCGLDNIASF
jgi:hypothetical protein